MPGPSRRTVFDTPIITPVLRLLALAALRLAGWRTSITLPRNECFLAVIAPHTSYWDLPILLATALVHRVKCHWLGSHVFFRGPAGPIMRWLGGIPLDHGTTGEGRVPAVVATLREHPVSLGVAPEAGFRTRRRWRTGFYHIAVAAGMPLLLVYLDYPTRTAGAGGTFRPSGDMRDDFARIRSFYERFRGRHHTMALPADTVDEI
jgi:1-acyl-sn-glycerol-3-phosphate acyltransferase